MLLSFKKSFFKFNTLFGVAVSMETLFSLKLLRFGFGAHFSRFQEEFVTNLPFQLVQNLEVIDFCHFSNLNLRYQMPVLNIYFRNVSLKKNILFTGHGSYSNLNYYVKHFGNSPSFLIKCCRGKTVLTPFFQFSAFPLYLTSSFFQTTLFHFSNLFQYS